MINKVIIASFLAILISLSSCSEYQKALKSNDRALKYEMAMEYYESEDWNKALTLIEDILPLYKGTSKGEQLLYRFAYCHYNLKDYILAGYYFRNFTQVFGNSELEEEAAFRSAECYYLDSPRSSLDQSSTKNALSELELFIIKHPHSKYVAVARDLKKTLNNKLAKKQYNNAKLYYHLGYYKSAITAFNSCLQNYPYSKFREDIIFDLLETNYLLAKNSISSKQNERFKTTIQVYHNYIDEFPDGEYVKDAKKIYNIANKRVNDNDNNNAI